MTELYKVYLLPGARAEQGLTNRVMENEQLLSQIWTLHDNPKIDHAFVVEEYFGDYEHQYKSQKALYDLVSGVVKDMKVERNDLGCLSELELVEFEQELRTSLESQPVNITRLSMRACRNNKRWTRII